jgi:hypothetical protein
MPARNATNELAPSAAECGNEGHQQRRVKDRDVMAVERQHVRKLPQRCPILP